MTDYDKIKHMCELQKALDERILQGRPYDFKKSEIALIREMGEMLGEVESEYKYWKKNTFDNRENLLCEIVDMLHFVISLNIHTYGVAPTAGALQKVLKRDIEIVREYNKDYGLAHILKRMLISGISESLYAMHSIMVYFNFTLDEVYTAYLEKNAVNHKRQEEGY